MPIPGIIDLGPLQHSGHTIGLQPMATCAFVGRTRKGPADGVYVIESIGDFEARFGSADPALPLPRALTLFFENGGRRALVVAVRAQKTPRMRSAPKGLSAAAILGEPSRGTGLQALADNDDFGLLLTPDLADMARKDADRVARACIKLCEARRATYLLELPRLRSGREVEDALAWARRSRAVRSDNAAVYFPPLKLSLFGAKVPVTSPSGAIAGVFARMEHGRGVWKAPAGGSATLSGVEGSPLTNRAPFMEQLQAVGINPLLSLPDGPLVIWGARGFGPSSASEWRYVSVRRLALMIEKSITRALSWVVFEPNDEALWAQLRLNVTSFMNELFRAGAFQGYKSSQAYFVHCDRRTMSIADMQAGIVRLQVGFAPVKPAEFVVLSLQFSAQPI